MAPVTWLRKLFDGIIRSFKNSSSIVVNSGDRIGISLRNNLLDRDPVYISLRRADQMDVDVVFDHIMKIFDSNKDFFLNGELVILFDHIQMPHGSGRVIRNFGQSNTDFISKKACYFKYKHNSKKYPNDNYCLPYALVITRAHARSKSGELKKYAYRNYLNRFKSLRSESEELCVLAGVNMNKLKDGCSLDEVMKFQNVLKNYQIVIYEANSKLPIYSDPIYFGKTKLNIMLHKNHFYGMRNITACFGAKYICPHCHTHTDTRAKHVCKYSCSQCLVFPKCSEFVTFIRCKDCNRTFFGEKCYQNHLKLADGAQNSTCEAKKNCPICFSQLTDEHKCGMRGCFTCEKLVPKNNHFCFMPQYETKRREGEKIKYVFFDLETRQDSLLNESEPEKFKHTPNLCVSQSVCLECADKSDISVPCFHCGGVRENIFKSEKCIEDFWNYLADIYNEKEEVLDQSSDSKKKKFKSKYKYIIVIAHNLKGFDGQFILKHIYESARFGNPNLIMNGTKVIEISFGYRLKFIDSINYFQCGLSKLPELYGIEETKGYFPHFFNTVRNQQYVGPLPKKDFYGYASMTEEGREDFDEWYTSHPKNYVFDFEKEFVQYCRQDVTLLRKACVKFQADFWEANNIDPFIDACTIAGACNKVFRANFLQEETIGILPPNGYRLGDKQSKNALKWLYFIEMNHQIEVIHAGRGREFSHPAFGRVDGYHPPSNTILEYMGCHWHGCMKCYAAYFSGRQTNKNHEILRQRRDATLAKNHAITQAGFNLVVKWECEFLREMSENDARGLNELLTTMVLYDMPIDPRDAFFGGRTDVNTMYFKSDDVTKIYYYDIMSLYPYINKASKAPLGHPRVHVGEECMRLPWMELDGLMKVTVLAPRGLHFPVLPYRMHHKLLFFLCHECAKHLNQFPCTHNDKLRQFTGTWVIDEVKLAVMKGYKIINIHEIWSYKVTQYDPVTRSGGFFSGFINRFLKIKAEASGWPTACTTQALKNAYLNEFFVREGIQLDETQIEYNPSLRQMAKIMLNSFWGRFGMRSDLVRTELIRCERVLRDRVLDPKKEIKSLVPINDDCLLINYKINEEVREANKTTNVVIAAFTTAYARMELYKYLDQLGDERVLYHDTDSVIFTGKAGEMMPEKGDFLGQMTDELEKYGVGSYITEFVSGGPKNYAIKIYSTKEKKIKTCVKVKGITLNYETSELINFDVIKNIVTQGRNRGEKRKKEKETVEVLGEKKKKKKEKETDEVLGEKKKKEKETVEVYNNRIGRTSFADVYSSRVKKTYSYNYTKKQEADEYRTLPYGF